MNGHPQPPPGAAEPPADELTLLLALATELATVTTLSALRTALSERLLPLLPSSDVSVLRAVDYGWAPVVGNEDALDRIHEYTWTTLVADGNTPGMLGIGRRASRPMSDRVALTATTMLAGTVQSVLALEKLRQDSVQDPLTGCYTRAHALELLEGNLSRANRTGFPVSIMMLDVDEFKAINDRFGHVPGDAVLAAVGTQLHKRLRRSDVRCRLGGDEFLVILPDTALEDALGVAENVRQAIESLVIPSIRGRVRVTASVGVAASPCGSAVDVAAFIDRADVALYRAKQAGRNCVQACASSGLRTRQSALRLAEPRGPDARLAESRPA
jgi:diguanylate cyclase (GGDEF)-like protein